MTDKTAQQLEQLIKTVEYLGTELIKHQSATHEAVVSLAEAIAGVRQKVSDATPAEPVEPPQTAAEEPEAPAETAPEPEPVTIADLRGVFAEKSRGGHKDALKALLTAYGATKLPELPEDKLAEVLAKASAL